jgi:hypothetical protein
VSAITNMVQCFGKLKVSEWPRFVEELAMYCHGQAGLCDSAIMEVVASELLEASKRINDELCS